MTELVQNALDIFEPVTLEGRFQKFHRQNPEVYQRLLEMARELKDFGHKKIGIQMLFEVLRWETMMQTTGDKYKINNSYASRYARLIMDQEPDLEGIFEVRGLKS